MITKEELEQLGFVQSKSLKKEFSLVKKGWFVHVIRSSSGSVRVYVYDPLDNMVTNTVQVN